ncbi:DUF1816 domain-containing protein [Pleurocapsa sp. FMAR1]|uniref:DUF1816 domain-containing protein n=1 Tax=Pleurocapsa sp. FMAR1 TaxID=3040204 RepID=UPI0029C93C28|nr:DUF1816 domain-containing protein [Pleurocapsa sp. FMAR1]
MSFATKLFEILGLRKENKLPYWLQISTKVPNCVYYFGPFDSSIEAKASQVGYIEDLMAENAQGIHIELKQCLQPLKLTICESEEIF